MGRLGREIRRELELLFRMPASAAGCVVLLMLAALAAGLGIAEIRRQQAAIAEFITLDAADRAAVLAEATDWGGAAYASFHATWQPPAPLAFAALGQRDVAPWLLRIRALALEGQIHEGDDPNPELALSGRFDLAFVAAFLLPLFAVILLHDLTASERESGRLPLLAVTAGRTGRLWSLRVGVRIGGLLLAVALPLWIGGVIMGAGIGPLVAATALIAGSLLVWTAIILLFAFRPWPAASIAGALAAVWLVLALLAPMVAKLIIDRSIPRVDGAEVALLQREAVNAAWDQPKDHTLVPFYRSHPEWAHSEPVVQPFHWKWYYAFQQRGDEIAAERSAAYRASIAARDRAAGRVSWISPSIAVLRGMQRLAGTDVQASLAYDAAIRAYHERMRRFYYPYLFEELPFDRAVLEGLPEFEPALPF